MGRGFGGGGKEAVSKWQLAISNVKTQIFATEAQRHGEKQNQLQNHNTEITEKDLEVTEDARVEEKVMKFCAKKKEFRAR